MSKVDEITRESWILGTFPEWGTWLNEEIEREEVKPGTFAMWWLGCTGIWLKSEKNTNILCDLWCGTGKRSHGNGKMKTGHQMQRMSGCQNLQPNLRTQPFVIDPFEVKNVDALVVTHIHSDHLDINTAAAVANNCPEAKFVGPQEVVNTWLGWGVPAERTIVVHPGDSVKIKDIEIVALEAFDRTALVTAKDGEVLKGKMPQDMDEIAVNYLFKTNTVSNIHNRVMYLASQYFIKNIIGSNNPKYGYANNTAFSKQIARISDREVELIESYVERDSFKNLDAFVAMLRDSLKLHKLTNY